jgi:hypothetical protein
MIDVKSNIAHGRDPWPSREKQVVTTGPQPNPSGRKMVACSLPSGQRKKQMHETCSVEIKRAAGAVWRIICMTDRGDTDGGVISTMLLEPQRLLSADRNEKPGVDICARSTTYGTCMISLLPPSVKLESLSPVFAAGGCLSITHAVHLTFDDLDDGNTGGRTASRDIVLSTAWPSICLMRHLHPHPHRGETRAKICFFFSPRRFMHGGVGRLRDRSPIPSSRGIFLDPILKHVTSHLQPFSQSSSP